MLEIPINKIDSEFKEFILERDHPCIMAKSVFQDSNYKLYNYKEFGSRQTAFKIVSDLKDYLSEYDFKSNKFLTFIATFDSQLIKNELTFELLLWKQLQYISDLDNKSWDNSVSDDPEDEHFSFSILGRAFYIVGMHPQSNRLARKSPYPCMIFNLHSQFDKLRDMNRYSFVRDKIRNRDRKLQGSINPMLQDFGTASEAKQYSGRQVDDSWKCPFSKK